MIDAGWDVTWEGINKLAAILSIVGFVLQIWVLWYVWRIQKRVYFVARVPNLVEELGKRRQELANLMRSFEANGNAIRDVIASSMPVVDSLRRKISGDLKADAKHLLGTMRSFTGGGSALGIRHSGHPSRESDCRAIYEMMIGLETSLQLALEDRSYEVSR